LDPARAGSPALTMPFCHPLAGSLQGPRCFAVAQLQKPKRLLPFSIYPRAPSSCHLPQEREAAVLFFAKAAALHFGKRKCLCGWMFYIPMTDCSPTADSQCPQRVPPAPAPRSRDGRHALPSGRHGAQPRLAFCRGGSLVAGNKLTFK